MGRVKGLLKGDYQEGRASDINSFYITIFVQVPLTVISHPLHQGRRNGEGMLDLQNGPPLKKKIKIYTTVLIRETEGLFKERVGRGIHLLQLPIVPWERWSVIIPAEASGLRTSVTTHHLIMLVCLFTSCSVIYHISLLISPERPANSARFSVGIKTGLTLLC